MLGGKLTPGTVAVDKGTETTKLGVVAVDVDDALLQFVLLLLLYGDEEDDCCNRISFDESFPNGCIILVLLCVMTCCCFNADNEDDVCIGRFGLTFCKFGSFAIRIGDGMFSLVFCYKN